jgi:hypothetical protein
VRQEESNSLLEKRTKGLLAIAARGPAPCALDKQEFFSAFFQKRPACFSR